jgi:hypothetical protein
MLGRTIVLKSSRLTWKRTFAALLMPNEQILTPVVVAVFAAFCLFLFPTLRGKQTRR